MKLLKGIETGDPESAAVVNENKYIQHNPRTGEGSPGLAELFARLDDALQHLPVERRVAFLLVEVHELGHEQVAEIEGVASGTIRSRVSRARTQLRALLEPEMEKDA